MYNVIMLTLWILNTTFIYVYFDIVNLKLYIYTGDGPSILTNLFLVCGIPLHLAVVLGDTVFQATSIHPLRGSGMLHKLLGPGILSDVFLLVLSSTTRLVDLLVLVAIDGCIDPPRLYIHLFYRQAWVGWDGHQTRYLSFQHCLLDFCNFHLELNIPISQIPIGMNNCFLIPIREISYPDTWNNAWWSYTYKFKCPILKYRLSTDRFLKYRLAWIICFLSRGKLYTILWLNACPWIPRLLDKNSYGMGHELKMPMFSD